MNSICAGRSDQVVDGPELYRTGVFANLKLLDNPTVAQILVQLSECFLFVLVEPNGGHSHNLYTSSRLPM
ncbi:MAG: hypothetical protein EA404_11700 [Spirochaetaceae bacterium]|nr:MAG: hypothetical protein EA404_11700 [Spirochaetaceae bacterium]